MAKIIGIDLGTTNSAVAVVEGGKPKIIHSEEGENIIPSVVDPVKRVAGRVAKRQAVVSPKTTIFSVKRWMGKKFKDKTGREERRGGKRREGERGGSKKEKEGEEKEKGEEGGGGG